MSLRLRLALLLTVMLAVTLFAFGAGMQVAVDRVSRETMTRLLAEETQQLVAARLAEQSNLTFQNDPEAGGVQIERVEMFQSACSLPRTVRRLRYWVGAGQVLPLSEAGLTALQQGQPWVEITALSEFENELHMIYSQPIVENDRWVGVAQVARPMTDQQNMLGTLRDLLLFGGGAATVVAFGLTWGLAGRTLQPLTRMTQIAQAISVKRDFRRRLESSSSRRPDEISRLAASLNATLDELHSAYQQVESSLEAQRDFVADVSHELRTPLTTVRGNLRLLQRDPLMPAPERDAVLRDAMDEIERMSRMVNELLLLARTDASATQTLRLAPIDVMPIVVGVAHKAMALAYNRTVLLEKRAGLAGPAESVIVMGNADALNQVLLILMDNAIKFTPPGAQITLSVSVNEDTTQISVRDMGIGISPEALPHIFERFYRAESPQTSPSGFGGHGLGLAIAKSLVEAQGGAIRVESEPGRGSMFTISLPLLLA